MGCDSRYRTSLSWMSDDDEPCSRKILVVIYNAIYDENSSVDVIRYLLRAYDAQWVIEAEEEEEAPATLKGDNAWQYMRSEWARVYAQELDHYRIPYKDIETSETFTWPEALPTDYPIRKRMLKTIGRRMGRADAWLTKCLRDARAHS